MQGLVTGLHWGLGFGLGAVLGGVLYAGLGARMCFGVSAVLPSLSLLLLALPAAWPWVSNSVVQCGLWATAFRQWTWGNGCAYESVAEVSAPVWFKVFLHGRWSGCRPCPVLKK